MAFLDLEKAFDKVNLEKFWKIFNRKRIPYHLISVIKSLYKNSKIQIDTGRKILDKMYINQGVWQGCSLSPTLFNLYIDDLFRTWTNHVKDGILLKRNRYFNTLLFVDDQLIIQDSEYKLQRFVHILSQMAWEYDLKISSSKTKIMAFRGKHLIRSKIVIDGSIMEQVNQFNYLGCELSLVGEIDLDKKLSQFQHVCGIWRKHLWRLK